MTQEPELQLQPNFLDMSKTGRHTWWQYLIGFVVILVGYIVIGGLVYWIPAMLALRGQSPKMDPKTGMIANLDPAVNYIALNATFFVLLVLIVAVVKLLHNRSITSLITVQPKVQFDRIWVGFGIWLVISTLITVIQYCVWPSSFKVSFSLQQFLMMAPIILLMTPVQAATEELLFRGYLLQGFSFVRNIWVLSFLNGLFFMLPHLGNPEMTIDPLFMALEYFSLGFIFAILTLKANGLEFCIGAHVANNLFNALFVNYSNSVLTTPSIFVNTEMRPAFDCVGLFATGAIFILLSMKYVNRKRAS